MSTYAVDGDKLTAIADAIRLKRDLTTDMTLDEMPLQIGLIGGGGGGASNPVTHGTINVTTANGWQTFPVDNLDINGTYMLFARRTAATAPSGSAYSSAIVCICHADKGLLFYTGGNSNINVGYIPQNTANVANMPLLTTAGIKARTYSTQYFTAGEWEYYACKIADEQVDIFPGWWTHVTN